MPSLMDIDVVINIAVDLVVFFRTREMFF